MLAFLILTCGRVGMVDMAGTAGMNVSPSPPSASPFSLSISSPPCIFPSFGETPPAILLDDCSRNDPAMIDPHGIPITYTDIAAVDPDNAADRSIGSKVSISYSDADIGGLDGRGLAIECYSNGAWEPLESTIDSANNTVTAIVPPEFMSPSSPTSTSSLTSTPTFTLALTYNGVMAGYAAADSDTAWSVQSGGATIAAGSISRDVILTKPVADISKAFLLMDSTGNEGAGNGGRHQATGHIVNEGTLRFERGVGAGDCHISWYVIECPDCSVQRGEVSFEADSVANTTTITSVDTSRSVVILHSRMNNDSNEAHQGYFTGALENSTTLRCERGISGTNAICRYEVVQFGEDVSVYTGEVELSGGAMNATGVISESVNTSRTWLYSTYRCGKNGLLNTSIGSELLSDNQVRFQRYSQQPCTNRIRWYVVEFPEGVTVRRGCANGRLGSGDLRSDIAIAPVDLNRSFSSVSSTSNGTGTEFPQNRWVEELVDPTTLRLERWHNGNGYEHWWQVIQFPETEPPVINTVVLNNTTLITGDGILVTVDVTDDTGVISVLAKDLPLTHDGGNIWSGTITAVDGYQFVNVSASDAAGNSAWHNLTTYTATTPDTTPPAGITDLDNTTYERTFINWTWTDPADSDFANVSVCIDGSFVTDVTKGIEFYNATGLNPDAEYTIATQTVDDSGNVNATWVNRTARTRPLPDTTAPASITNLHNTTYEQTFINWTWTDPADSDFAEVIVYLNGSFVVNVAAGIECYNATGLALGTEHEIATHTVDLSGNANETWANATARTRQCPDTTPPAAITDLTNTTYEETFINWTWTDPIDSDFSEVMIRLNGNFAANVSNGTEFYNAAGLDADTEYAIATQSVDTSGNINETWMNATAKTRPLPAPAPLHHINITPTPCTLNISEEARFHATGYDQYNNSITGLTFLWHLNSSGIGMLDRMNGSAVNFTALHAGITEIYVVNGSISGNETCMAWITVNAPPGTGIVVDGVGDATSGDSTAIVNITDTLVVGTISIKEIDCPLNHTEVNGSTANLETDVGIVKGVDVNLSTEIANVLADDASGKSCVHIRIGYNETELGGIEEETLEIYKFVNGTGWLRMDETENPEYCIGNGRDTTADYVWANVTSCSVFGMGGGSSTASESAPPAILSWWNNRTDDSTLNLTVATTEPVEFSVVSSETGNITWNAADHLSRSNETANSGNQTFLWDKSGSKYLNVSTANDNGISETLCWNITVTDAELPEPAPMGSGSSILVNETGWWYDGGAFNPNSAPIRSAVGNATDGAHIFVYNGSYTENVVINRPITLEGEGLDMVDVVSADVAGRVFDVGSSWVNISGFSIRGVSDAGTGVYLYEADHCNISYNNITGNWYGIDLRGSNYNNISNNAVVDNRYGSTDSSGYGIHLYDDSSHNTMINNIVEHNGHGIGIRGSGNSNTLHTNVVTDNRDGIYVASRYNLIYNNYILFNEKFGARDITGDNSWNTTKIPGRNIVGGSHLGGNYYSEYTGSDEDGDGLGDTPFIISAKDTEDHHPLVSTIRVSDRWNSKTGGSNLTLTADIGESIDFRINYTQAGDIFWKVTDQMDREDPSCSGATQTYSWSNPGVAYVDCWLTNEENGTSNKTEWNVIISTDVKGRVTNDSGGPLVSDITYYDTDGGTALDGVTSSTFNFTAVPMYGYLEIDAFSTKSTSVRFCISGTSTSAVITIDETKENPASFEFSELPVKYIRMQPASLAYNNSIITIRYSEGELNGTSEGALAIYKMRSGSWQKLATERDTENNTLTASTSTASSGWFMVGAQTGVGTCTRLLITTDKATYLLDPYYWVYEASSYGWGDVSPGDLWSPNGYPRTVDVTVLLMDNRGYRAAADELHYTVSNGTTIVASGTAHDRGDGLYTASFEITDADSGGRNFDGSDPEYFTIRAEANTSGGVIDGSKTFRVGRWGCDRCHVGYKHADGWQNSTAMSMYPWARFPNGGPGGPHNWHNIMGGNGADKTKFNISYLTNSELTHTPSDYLNTSPYHEMTERKQGGNPQCSPCHQGSGRLRYNYSATGEYPWLAQAKAEAVECTFCHGMDGGYNETYWADIGGYTYGEHARVVSPPDTDQDPYLAHQSCSNASCHGHISNSDAGAIDNAYPTCADCHPISFGSDVPQWLDTQAGKPRDVGGHPSGDSGVVNCSFCHNAFHATSDESAILTCDDCHPESVDYPIHPYEGYSGENTATCANCHCGGADNINIHNISVPRCSDCHSAVYDDLIDGYNNYAMDNDSENLAPGGSNMTHKRDTRVASAWGSDPQGMSMGGESSGILYSRHAYPDSSGGWDGATGPARKGDQICLNCHSDIVRTVGVEHEQDWNSCYAKVCHNLWTDDEYGAPNVHYLAIPHCTDCHSEALSYSGHLFCDVMDAPKNYARAPAIGTMLEDSVHKRLIMNTTTDNPSNYLGCLICHTNASFEIDYGDFEITITEYDGVHVWNSLPQCTKCHSLQDDVSRPGPPAYAHDLLEGIEWGNNTQCLKCHNIYNQTAGRYHGHDAKTESCSGCHYNNTAMDDYGAPDVYVNEVMYKASVHGTDPGDDCSKCHTDYHPPPEYKWKWCDCCHVVQSDPVNDVDRHNVTASPTTLDVTDCAECHNETSYDTSVSRYGGASSAYNCRWCHTYPDQRYE
ncbi:MAG: hypothetical protein C5S47_05915 [Candidatus Methanogasteraceae archaeon]|nr:MAG: hypothetical protein C5S47_05915 [ANME-2 cluster archaeon]